MAEESLLLETEVLLGEFHKSSVESTESEAEPAEEESMSTNLIEQELSKSRVTSETDVLTEEKEPEDVSVDQENSDHIGVPQVNTRVSFTISIVCKRVVYNYR